MPQGLCKCPVPIQRGRQARLDGSGVNTNPYDAGSLYAIAWLMAWTEENSDIQEATIALVHKRGREHH